MPGGAGLLLGWIALIAGVGAGVITVFEGPSCLPLALGLLICGAVWIVHGKHLSRRPSRHVQVNPEGLRLMPEGQRFALGGLDPLVILERKVVSSQTNVAYAATVYSEGADVALIRLVERTEPEARAAAEAWIAQLESAQAGRLSPDAITALDARIEGPAAEFTAGATALSLLALGLAGVAYSLVAPDLIFGVGVGVTGIAAVSSWRLIDRRGPACVVGLAVGTALVLRPILLPVTAVMAPDAPPEAVGLFAEVHLGLLIGGALSLIAGAVGGHRAAA